MRLPPPRLLERIPMLSRRRTAVLLLLLALGAAAPAARAEAVAVVNGEPISRAEFGLSLVRSLGRSVMDAFVDRALLEQEARRLGLTVSEREIAEAREAELAMRLRAVAYNARMGPEEFRILARVRGWDMAQFRRQLEEGISEGALRVQVLAAKILLPHLDLSEAALGDYYARTRGRRYVAAHIVVAGRAAAEGLLAGLQADPERWERAVLQHSLDRGSVPYKGRIRPVAAASELGNVLAQMRPAELKLHRAGERWHVLRLVKVVPPAEQPFEQVRDELRAELLARGVAERLDPLLAALNRKACVVPNLSFDRQVRGLLGEETAVFVNGQAIPVERLAEALVDEFGDRMLEPYVERTLILQEARRRGLSVEEAEFQARWRAIGQQVFGEQAAQRGISAQEMERLLARAGMDAEQFRQRLVQQSASPADVRATLLAEKMVEDGVEVTEVDIAEAYRELGAGRFVVKELAARSVEAAERMHRKVQQGADFDLVAGTEMSEPGLWLAGGLLRTVTSSHPYYPYVKNLGLGDVSVVFEWDGKYRIIKLVEEHLPSDPPPLESVRASLEQQVRLRKARARIRALLVRLKAESDIQINPG
jgi:foldase protein PrsA